MVSANTDETGSIAIRIIKRIFRIRAFILRVPDTLAAEFDVWHAIRAAGTIGASGCMARANWAQNPASRAACRAAQTPLYVRARALGENYPGSARHHRCLNGV
jgi:hypothetical protein